MNEKTETEVAAEVTEDVEIGTGLVTVEEEYEAPDAIDGPQFFNGTYCHNCYLLFAKSGGYKIGIRPLFNSAYDQTYIGFRIRAMVDETADIGDADFTGGDSISEAFPNFPFKKHSAKRCSLVGGAFVGIGNENGNELVDWMTKNRIVGKVMSSLKELLGDIEIIDEGAVYEYLGSEYEKMVESGVLMKEGGVDPTIEVMGTVVHMDDYKAKQELDQKLSPAGSQEETQEAED